MTAGRYVVKIPGMPTQRVDVVVSAGGFKILNLRRYGMQGEYARLIEQGVRFKKLGAARRRTFSPRPAQ